MPKTVSASCDLDLRAQMTPGPHGRESQDPPVEGLQKQVEVQEVMATIFSKEPIDLRNPIDEPGEEEIPAGDVEVINPITGEIDKIRSNEPSYYDAGGFKARNTRIRVSQRTSLHLYGDPCLLRREELQ